MRELEWRLALQAPAPSWQTLAPSLPTLSLLPGATDRRVKWVRNGLHEVTFSLEHEHEDAYLLLDQLARGIPIIRAWRTERQADQTIRRRIRFAGIVTGLEEDTSDGMKVTATIPLYRLAYRLTAELDDHPFEDAGEIVRQLIADQAARWPLDFTVGTVEATVARDATYEYATPLDQITELSGMGDGFDLKFAPSEDGASLGVLTVVRALGTDRPNAAFGYGPGTVANCTSASRKWLPPRTAVRAFGDDGVSEMWSHWQGVYQFGVWEETTNLPGTVDLAALYDASNSRLTAGWRQHITFTPDPAAANDDGRLICPVPGIDYDLGDLCPVTIRKGAWRSDSVAPIDEIAIAIDDDGSEAEHELTILDTTTES